jgi:MPBQ/MSBQ methyltransferase
MKTSTLNEKVALHYGDGQNDLLDRILDGARKAGADPDNLKPSDLGAVDEFHTAGRGATIEVLSMVPLKPGMHVLDAGCGIGGTARSLVAERGCRATGIDLTPGYVDVANALAVRMNLADKCGFVQGSVLDMPFAEAAFDGAVSFHVAMNIEDRAGFYGELARVVKPGGPVCVYDVMKGPVDGVSYPMPWAATGQTSFLRTPDETASLLKSAGFNICETRSLREFALDFFAEAFKRAAAAGGPPPLGLHLLTGADTKQKFANIFEAYKAHQLDPVAIVATRV